MQNVQKRKSSNMRKDLTYDFVVESNKIENIIREPTREEIDELVRFINLGKITVEDLVKFVSIYQPDARLRDEYGMNVRIGNYYPPFGGPDIVETLRSLLGSDYNVHRLHIEYEKLHPFSDCNGRSGRALWAWHMKDLTGGFLLNFYYQTLQLSQ